MSRFHVLIPPTVPFDSSQDKVVVRGLASWSLAESVEMTCVRQSHQGTLVLGSTILPRGKAVGKVLEYKYQVVPYQRARQWEDLRPQNYQEPSHSKTIWNRSLRIPGDFKDKFYEKYDDVILVNNNERKEMRKLATTVMLPSLEKIIRIRSYQDLCHQVMKFRNVVVAHIDGVDLTEKDDTSKTGRKALPNYQQVCKKLLADHFDVIVQLYKENGRPSLEDGVSISLFYLSLYSVLPRHLPDLNSEFYQIILNFLRPDGKVCRTLEIVSDIVREDERVPLADTIEMALKEIVRYDCIKENPGSIFVLLAIVHYLRGHRNQGTWQEALEGKKTEQFWGFNKITCSEVRKVFHKQQDAIGSLELIKDLSKTDPILKLSFLRCLTFGEFLSVLSDNDHIRFFGLSSLLACSLTWLHKDESKKVDHKKLADTMKDCLSSGLAQQKEKQEEKYISDLCFGSRQFLNGMMKLSAEDGLSSSFELLIVVHLHFKALGSDNLNLSELKELTDNYIIRRKSKFGYGRKFDVRAFIKVLSELVWLADGLDQVVDVVQRHLEAALSSAVHPDDIVGAYLDLDDLHPQVEKKLKVRALSVGLDVINNPGLVDKVMTWLGFGNRRKLSKYAELLAKAFDSSSKDLNVEDDVELVNFVMSDQTLKVTLMISKEISWLFEAQFERLRKIVIKFLGILVRAQDGRISVDILRKISPDRLSNSGLSLDVMLGMTNLTDPVRIMESLELRTEELNYYLNIRELVVRLLREFNNGRIRNFSRQIDRFPDEGNLGRSLLLDICHPRKDKMEEIVPKVEPAYLENINLIRQFFSFKSSTLFIDSIDDCIDNLSSFDREDPSNVSSMEVPGGFKEDEDVRVLFKIISDGIKTSEKIGDNLADFTISLNDVDRYFGRFKNDIIGLKKELNVLKDLLQLEVEDEWSEYLADKIACFFQIGNLKEAAVTLTNVAKLLGVDKPFPAIRKILQMQDLQNGDVSIAEITEQDLQCGAILSQWSKADFQALEAVEKSMNLIKWIRVNMVNFQQFKVFVELASISAGEEDIEVDRVQHMQAAVSAYQCLIFDLGAKSDFQRFSKAMSHLVRALRKDENIPTKLIDTNRHLAWIKVIKERHGSVETSSLQQVEAVNKTGRYYIGNFHRGEKRSLRLKFLQVHHEMDSHGKKEDYEKELLEDDLKELQSKLMLISKNSEARNEVEEFVKTFGMATRLRSSLKKLFSAGCNLTRKLLITFSCQQNRKVKVSRRFTFTLTPFFSQVEIDFGRSGLLTSQQPLTSELPTLAEFLDDCQEDWSRHLAQLRLKYPVTRSVQYSTVQYSTVFLFSPPSL